MISIHALLAESDRAEIHASTQQEKFLSTLSLRRATTEIWPVIAEITISIHALLAESDQTQTQKHLISQIISIHALLAESDKAYSKIIFFALYFYPRSPCGERQMLFRQSA